MVLLVACEGMTTTATPTFVTTTPSSMSQASETAEPAATATAIPPTETSIPAGERLAFAEITAPGKPYPESSVITFANSDGSQLEHPSLYQQFAGQHQHLVFSPNGRYLVFNDTYVSANRDRAPSDLYVADTYSETVAKVELPEIIKYDPWYGIPSWSSDSKLITFIALKVESAAVSTGIFAWDTVSRQLRQIPTEATDSIYRYATWSPFGESILFASFPEPLPTPGLLVRYGDLYTMKSDGTELSALGPTFYKYTPGVRSPNPMYLNEGPVWSPDGQWIAFFFLKDSESPAIGLKNVTSHELRVVELASTSYWDLAWSPDSTRLAFVGHQKGDEIFLLTLDSGQITNLTQSTGDDFNPTWSPSGHQIAFISDREENESYKLYVMNADGTNPAKVSDAPVMSRPVWIPESNP